MVRRNPKPRQPQARQRQAAPARPAALPDSSVHLATLHLAQASVLLDCLAYRMAYLREGTAAEKSLQWSDAAVAAQLAHDLIRRVLVSLDSGFRHDTAPHPGATEAAC